MLQKTTSQYKLSTVGDRGNVNKKAYYSSKHFLVFFNNYRAILKNLNTAQSQ